MSYRYGVYIAYKNTPKDFRNISDEIKSPR